MTWRKGLPGTDTVIWEEEYPGHHRITLVFNLQELKQQLGLFEISEEVQ